MGVRFPVIMADPPWNFKAYSDKGMGRSAEVHYDTMTRSDIANLPVAQVAAAPAPEEKKKGKGLVISKKEKAVEPAPVPEPVEVSQPAISIGEEPSAPPVR